MPCLSPLFIDRERKHFVSFRDMSTRKLDIVPCGKCVECVKSRQNKMCVRILEECKKFPSDSLHFVTLTYDPQHLPFCGTFCINDNGSKYYLETSKLVEDGSLLDELRSRMSKCVDCSEPQLFNYPLPLFDGAYGPGTSFFALYTPSLDRRDPRLWLKRCRVEFKRTFGYALPVFKYVMVGEYGARYSRPHFHIFFMGLPTKTVCWLLDRWDKGMSNWKKLRSDESSKYNVARYVAKYTTKGSFECPTVTKGLAIKGRFCASKSLGLPASFPLGWFYAWDIFGKYDPDTLKLEKGDYLSDNQLNVLINEIPKRMSVAVPSLVSRLPLPDSWKHLIYYNKYEYKESKNPPRYVPKTIYKLVQEDIQSSLLADCQREFEESLSRTFRESPGFSLKEAVLRFNDSKKNQVAVSESAGRKVQRLFYSSSAL